MPGRRARTAMGATGPRRRSSRMERKMYEVRPSVSLSTTLPTNPSHTTTSAGRAGQLVRLDVAHEVQVRGSEPDERLARQGVALLRLLADVEQRDPRLLDVEDALGVERAHRPELDQVLRLGVDVGAHVEQDERSGRGQEVGRQAPDGRCPPRVRGGRWPRPCVAPVEPALTTASAAPSRTRSVATRIEERRRRTPAAGDSPISTTSGASTNETLAGRPRPYSSTSRSRRGTSPTRMTSSAWVAA